MTMSDPKSAAIFAAVTKFAEIVEEWAEADRDEAEGRRLIAKADEQKSALREKVADCYVIARLYSFNLNKEWRAYSERQNKPLFPDPFSPLTPVTDAATAALTEANPKTIKEHVIDAARQAYPRAIRASALRQRLDSAYGKKTHEKTIGMTLYRLSKDGILRRHGWDWFFVPEGERRSPEAKENPDAATSGHLQQALT